MKRFGFYKALDICGTKSVKMRIGEEQPIIVPVHGKKELSPGVEAVIRKAVRGKRKR